MNIAELSMKKSVVTWVVTILLVAVGMYAFDSLSRLEDPEFTIKEATVTTTYPGASAMEVQEEVTNVIEKAVQELGQLLWVESRSSRGLSIVKVRIKDQFDKQSLPQVWDELRRKVGDYQRQLPPGAGPSLVGDDFGDVYGMYLAITGEGYTYKEMYEYAKMLQRELLKADDVKRIVLYGEQKEIIYVEMRRDKMMELGVSQQQIYAALGAKNLPAASGNLTLGNEYIPVNPTGEFKTVEDMGDLLIKGSGQGSASLVFLRDVADIKRGYIDPPRNLMYFNGQPAIGLGISTILGGDVMKMGKSLDKRFKELESQKPIGMELNPVYLQTDAVETAIGGFVISLLEAIAIVVVVLLIFMGLRSGLIIGAVLLITILGTFIFMLLYATTLERVSLGALVIALGMLVDNAIVVTDGMRVKMSQGMKALQAAKEVVGQTGVPLLGATAIAITAFASIGTSDDATGEYCRTLFTVIMISLGLSWVTAVTTTPLFCRAFLKTKKTGGADGEETKDPYAGKIFQLYKKLLIACINARWVTVAAVVVIFAVSLFGFRYVKNSFFPNATTPMFYVDFWFPEGTHINETRDMLAGAQKEIISREGVTQTTTTIGGGQIRFMLTYNPEYTYPSFGQILVGVKEYSKIAKLSDDLQNDLAKMLPQAMINVRHVALGPSTGGKLQLRIIGPDPKVLRDLSDKVEAIYQNSPSPRAKAVRNEWRGKIKVLRPRMAETQARRAGIERPDVAQALQAGLEGTQAGVYREKDELLPIVARSPESERTDMDNLGSIPIWSPVAQKMMPLEQVITRFDVTYEDPYIWRRDRRMMVRFHADPREGLASDLLKHVKPLVELALGVDTKTYLGEEVPPDKFTADTIPVKDNDLIPLKGMPGYYISWGGEAEDSARAISSLGASVPVFFGIMILLCIVLFNSIKKTLIIWLCVPLAIIGVTTGLLMFNQPFGFMAMLGLMSLAGMLIKNAIVLIDQITLELKMGKPPFQAVVDSGVSRVIPVSMAALTTILGMIPLLADAFFISMAVTIMFGLGFATILTLVIVPVFYSIFYNVHRDKGV